MKVDAEAYVVETPAVLVEGELLWTGLLCSALYCVEESPALDRRRFSRDSGRSRYWPQCSLV